MGKISPLILAFFIHCGGNLLQAMTLLLSFGFFNREQMIYKENKLIQLVYSLSACGIWRATTVPSCYARKSHPC